MKEVKSRLLLDSEFICHCISALATLKDTFDKVMHSHASAYIVHTVHIVDAS